MVSDVVELTRELIRVDTVNPPGNEERAAALIAPRLEAAGYSVTAHELAPGRPTLVARLAGTADLPALALSGHLDTVPVGDAPWSVDPFGAEIDGDLLYGRGASDMKGGLAALVIAAERLAAGQAAIRAPLVLIITAGEERACEGAAALVAERSVLAGAGPIGALLVAEPTGNRVCVAHKGVLWLRASTVGKSAHGSSPQRGVNAIYPLARAVAFLDTWVPPGGHSHPLLGSSTLNLGTLSGGSVINSVADGAVAELDIRLVPGQASDEIVAALTERLGPAVTIERELDLDGVATDPAHPWVDEVIDAVVGASGDGDAAPAGGLQYFTDASVLVPALGNIPAIICGPGFAEQAHVTDEHCSVGLLEIAADAFTEVARRWCSG